MSARWILCLSPLIALLCNVAMQITSSRLTCKVALPVFTGLFAGLFTNIIILYVLYYSLEIIYFTSNAFSSLMTYLSLSFCYWGFLNLNRTSLRIRLLHELLIHQSSGVSKETLFKIYSPVELIHIRLQRLQNAGKIILQDGKWKIRKEKARELFLLALMLAFLRKLIIPSTYSIKIHETKEN